jgi:hypothetical protein
MKYNLLSLREILENYETEARLTDQLARLAKSTSFHPHLPQFPCDLKAISDKHLEEISAAIRENMEPK